MSCVQCKKRGARERPEHAGTVPNALRTHKYTSTRQHAISLQPHARLMHHTTHSTPSTRRVVSTMASSLQILATEMSVTCDCLPAVAGGVVPSR
jgi:hypothetical protein